MANDFPDYQPHENLSGGIVSQATVPVPSYDATAGAKALSGLGSEISAVAAKIDEGQQHTLASAGMSQYLQQRDDITQKYKDSPDFENAEANAKNELQAAQNAALQNITDPRIRGTASLEMTRSSISAQGTVRDAQFTRQQQINVGSLTDGRNAARTDALNAATPVERQAAIERYANEVKRVADAGWIDNKTALAMGTDFSRDLQTADAMKAIQLDPAKGKALLADANNFPLLDAVTRQQFMQAADIKNASDRQAKLQQHAIYDPVGTVAAIGISPSPDLGRRVFGTGILGIETANMDNSAVSPAGAVGIAQILPSTARDVAKGLGMADFAKMSDEDIKAKLLADPELGKKLGGNYFDQLLARYDGNIPLAAAAYNGGMGRADKWRDQAVQTYGSQFTAQQLQGVIGSQKRSDGSPAFQETVDYLARLYGKLGAPMDVGFSSIAERQQASSAVNTVLRAQDASQQKVRNQMAATAMSTTNVGQMLQKGYDQDPQTVVNYRATLQAAANGGDQGAIKGLQELDYGLAIYPFIKQAKSMPPQQLEAQVQNMRAEATAPGSHPTPMQIRALEAFDSVLQEQVKTRDTEPVALIGENGANFAKIVPLNASAPIDDSLIGTLRDRDAQALQAKHDFGGSGSPFLVQEADAWHQRYADATPQDRTALLGVMAKGFSQQTFAAALPQVVSGANAKSDRPGIMVAAGLWQSNPAVAASIVQSIDSEENYLPTKGNDRTVYNTEKAKWLPPALFTTAARLDPNGPYAGMADAIDARYAYLSAQANDNSKSLDSNRMKRAADDVTGGFVWHNGVPTIVPAPGMSQNQFDGVIWGLKDTDLAGAQTSSGKPIDAEYVRDSAKLRARTDGQYYLQLNLDNAKPQYAVTKAGTPFVLDLRNRQPGTIIYDPLKTGMPQP